MKKRYTFIVLGLLGVSLAACAASRLARAPANDGISIPFDLESAAVESVIKMDDSYGGEFDANVANQTAALERIVIRNANLVIVVEDPSASASSITQLAEQMGGYVVSLNVYQSTYGDGIPATYGSITIRVPAERLDEALDEIKEGTVEVRSENISGQDVTQEYTDLQSQLRNLEIAEEELREIMGSLTKAEDVLRVYENLRQVRQEIEIIKGRMQYFEQSARLSAISIELLPDIVSQPLQIGRWQPEGTAKEALQSLIKALQWLANTTIWFVILVLPVLLLLSLPFWVLRWIIIRRRARKVAPKAED
ncbi:MAG: DUF4349 domain-containing protein [Anaerolineales bacterium]|nr:DUF4349 domain-containing protein [Anaerolineales bacterium]